MTEVSLPVFAVFAAVALLSALMVVTRKNPVHSALYLVVTLFSVAGIYVLLRAEFLAAVQILVYAGGIMVLFIFVIFLVRPSGLLEGRFRHGRHVVVAVVLCLLVIGALGSQLLPSGGELSARRLATEQGPGNLEWVSMSLFRHYLLPFETVSILLLVALVGAIVLAKPGD